MYGKRLIAALAAASLATTMGCETMKTNRTAQGAVVGTAGGALAGAIIGEANGGNASKGALIGAVAGGLIGTGIGYYLQQQKKDLQRIENATVTESQEVDPQTNQTVPVLAVSMSDQVLFDFNSSALRPEAQSALGQVAAVLMDPQYPAPKRIIIVGHTDNVGDYNYNKQLSQRRAQAVKDYLTIQGVNPDIITPVGVGPDQPIASNSTAEGQAQNRRVEIRIVPGQ